MIYTNSNTLFRGIVEDNESPKKDGRLRVRIFGIHSQDKSLVPTDTLPWAEVMQSLAFGYGSGTGITSVPRTGTWVFVILENDNSNNPIVIGAINGKAEEPTEYQLPMPARTGYQDVNGLAKAGYPYNHVIETLAGHVIEIDDFSTTQKIRICHTNGNEVLLNDDGIHITSIANRNEVTSGKYNQTVLNTIEINANGSISINTSGSMNLTSNGVTNILANNDINFKSDAIINVSSKSHTNVNVGGNATVDVVGNMSSTVHGNSTSTVTGTTDITSTGACSLTAEAGLTANVTGTANVTSSAAMKLKGSVITLQSNSNTMVI